MYDSNNMAKVDQDNGWPKPSSLSLDKVLAVHHEAILSPQGFFCIGFDFPN